MRPIPAFLLLVYAGLTLISCEGLTFTEDSNVDHCGCVERHPQQMFCSSEAAFKGTLLSQYALQAAPSIRIPPRIIMDPVHHDIRKRSMMIAPPPAPTKRIMPSSPRRTVTSIFRVDKVFKGNILPDTEIKVGSVEDGSGCQISFAVNRTYLVTGKFDFRGNIDLSSCDWAGCWEYGVSRFQKINLGRKGYRCDTKICHEGSKCAIDPKTCIWPTGHKGMCYSKHAKCYMSSRFGKAVWATLHSRMKRCYEENVDSKKKIRT